MSKRKSKKNVSVFGNVKVLVFAALLCAISGVFKLIAPSGDTWRISFENFPIIFAGIVLGPVIGAIVGIGADLLGCLFRGYAINFLITLASMAVGLISGTAFKMTRRFPDMISIAIAAFSAHMIANVIIKTFILSAMYGSPLGPLFLTRFATYIVTALVESVIIIILYRNKAIKKGLKRVIGSEL